MRNDSLCNVYGPSCGQGTSSAICWQGCTDNWSSSVIQCASVAVPCGGVDTTVEETMRKEVAKWEPVVEHASVAVPCGDVDTTVEEIGRKEVQKWRMQAPLKVWKARTGVDHDLMVQEVKEKSMEMRLETQPVEEAGTKEVGKLMKEVGKLMKHAFNMSPRRQGWRWWDSR
jgi:hypothetical protein